MKSKFYILRSISALLTFVLSVNIYFGWHNFQLNLNTHSQENPPSSPAAEPRITQPEQSFLDDKNLQSNTLDSMSSAQAESVIAHRAESVILALKSKNMRRLAAFVHPDKGLRFSQYECVNKRENLVFKRNELKKMWLSKKRYLWGGYDGTGDPIRLTFKSYYHEFVYDRDYAKAKQISFNSDFEQNAQSLEDEYRQPISVKYHFPELEGMDWKSLWLIFEKKNRVWYLAGIIHGEWTI